MESSSIQGTPGITVNDGRGNTGPAQGGPGGGSGGHRPANVSKSDLQLFDELAPVVRLLGIAADSAEQAYSAACQYDHHRPQALVSAVEARDQRETGEIQSGLIGPIAWAAYRAAHVAHQEAARIALERVKSHEPVWGSSEQMPALTFDNVMAAWRPHPMKHRGLVVVVPEVAREDMEAIALRAHEEEPDQQLGWTTSAVYARDCWSVETRP